MQGKQKCRILKEIRQRIADENDIPYVTQECRHQGNCSGTCPRCESELRYLEQQLALRASLGKRVAVAALCAGMAFAGAGCTSIVDVVPVSDHGEQLSGVVAPVETVCPTEEPEVLIEMGEVAWNVDIEDPDETPALSSGDDAVYIPDELSGMVPYDAAEESNG